MPTLKFLITNKSITYGAKNGSEEWVLVPDAVFQRNYKRFEVVLGSDIYDGFGLEYNITIKQRTPDDIAWVKERAELAKERSGGEFYIDLAEGCVGTIMMGYSIENHILPYFEITVLLAPDAFFHIQKHLEKYPCHMSLKTPIFQAGLTFGDDPNGNDLRWFLDGGVDIAIAESISLRFKPHPIDTLDSESSPVVKPQDRPLPIPVVVNAADFSRGINRLLWVVIFVGLALILKAYL